MKYSLRPKLHLRNLDVRFSLTAYHYDTEVQSPSSSTLCSRPLPISHPQLNPDIPPRHLANGARTSLYLLIISYSLLPNTNHLSHSDQIIAGAFAKYKIRLPDRSSKKRRRFLEEANRIHGSISILLLIGLLGRMIRYRA
jgi:hypothetical protein